MAKENEREKEKEKKKGREGGYSPDYYLCVDELLAKAVDLDSAEAYCEVMYG